LTKASLSPERLYIRETESCRFADDDNITKHLARYRLAQSFIPQEGTVLDCACGSGYGTKMLGERGCNVIGIDVSSEAIEFAKSHHSSKNISFEVADIAQLTFPSNSFDAIVSIETIEHIPLSICRRYLLACDSWLKPGGLLFASSPMLRFRNGSPFVTNPYHINEMKKEDLLELFHSVFSNYNYMHLWQTGDYFRPLGIEHEGFCILIYKKPEVR